jgi:hypothetical protein
MFMRVLLYNERLFMGLTKRAIGYWQRVLSKEMDSTITYERKEVISMGFWSR